MAKTPDIRVKISADGVKAIQAQFRAIQASARAAMRNIQSSAVVAQKAMVAISRPIRITLTGLSSILRATTAAVALGAAMTTAVAAASGPGIVQAGKSLDAINTSLKIGAVSAAETEAAIERISSLKFPSIDQVVDKDRTKATELLTRSLRATANQYGVSVEALLNSQAKLNNAVKGTAAQGEIAIRTIKGLAAATRALGLTKDEADRIGVAIAQIGTKGKVSAEEMQQLAEAGVPAMAIAARAFGVTTKQWAAMQFDGVESSLFLEKFSRQLLKEFGPTAEEAAKKPAAAFERMGNAIFFAKAALANSGIMDALAKVANHVTAVIQRMDETGQLAAIGMRIGAAIERLPNLFQRTAAWVAFLSGHIRAFAYNMGIALGVDYSKATSSLANGFQRVVVAALNAAQSIPTFVYNMRLALGLDYSQMGASASAGFGQILSKVFELIHTIPLLVYNMRMALTGQTDKVTTGFEWVIPIANFINQTLIPTIKEIPGIVKKWAPVFIQAAGEIIGMIGQIKEVLFATFGEEAGRKLIAYLVIGKFLGILPAISAAFSAVSTAVSFLSTVLSGLRVIMLGLFTGPAAPFVLAGMALAGIAYLIYKNWESIKGWFKMACDALAGLWNGLVDIFGNVATAMGDVLMAPFKAAWAFIEKVFGWVKAGWQGAIGGVKRLLGLGDGEESGGPKPQVKLATGGYIARGPGTTTSDSISAALSVKEGVINARATKHYGGAAFISAINSLQLPMPGAPEGGSGLSSGRPMQFVMPDGAISGTVGDDFADSAKSYFSTQVSGRGRRRKARGYS